MTELRQVGKLRDRRKKLADFPAAPESEPSFHNPGAAETTALRSWGIPDNPPDVVERAYDGERKKA